MKTKWIKISEQRPPANTIVWVRRKPNKAEQNGIYLAMRNDKPLSTNPDPSRDCYWHGVNERNAFKQSDPYQIKLDSSFSDKTVIEWTFIKSPFKADK